jgi:CTP:molybdopterin cytidylyltransferase MocA
MTHQITPVILCGGSGTRLWPLSRKSFPKQFVPLIGEKSLLQLTFERVRGLGADPLIVAAEDHRFMVTDVLQAAGMSGHVMLEPVARNTAAAMAIAALTKSDTKDDLLLFCPADHHIPDTAAFIKTIQQGVAESREKFNDEIMQPGFRWSEDINGITYLVRTRWDNMPEVVARVNNREVGRATFINHHTRSGLESVSTYVSPKWQGWGIAKNMYAVMRMLGANIQPSATQTAMGKDMWAKWKKGGDTKHLTSMNAKIDEQGVTEFAPAANDDNDKKAYLLQLAQALGDAMYGPNKNKQVVLDIKSKIVDAGGDVKILWNDDGTFNVVMYHPTYFKQGYLIKLVGGQAPGSLSENNKVESKLSVDVPNEEWLQDKIDYAQSKGRNSYGVPYMGSTTASVRGAPPRVRVMRLASLPGMRNEQMNVRKNDLKWLMDYMDKNKRLPPMGSRSDEEYLPYVMVAYNGEAWVNEGNHRIMAAYRLNWQDMPIEIRYFDGGERIENGPMAPGKIGLA